MRSRARTAACLFVVLSSTNVPTKAFGQPRPPGTAQPGQIERQFERPPEPTARPGVITIPATEQRPPANADAIRFTLNAVTLDGVSAYRPDALRASYEPLLHRDVTLADVYRVVDTLTARYRNDGYILSQVVVPAQSVENGVVRLQAIEGYIAAVRVEGGDDRLRARATEYGRQIQGRRPLTIGTLERSILLLNDLPGVQARAVLAPGATPGASDLVIQLSQRPMSAGMTADNRGSRAQGPQRMFAVADLHSLPGGTSNTEVRGVTSLHRELLFVGLSHDRYAGPHAGKVSISGSYVFSRPQELAIIPLDLETTSATAAVAYSYPLLRRRSRNVYVRGTLTAFNSESTIFGVRDTADRTRAVRLGATYDSADGFGGVNVVDAEFSQGIAGLGASVNGDEYLSRPSGRADFRKIDAYAARTQALRANWSIALAATAQYAFTDLLAPELFSIGGELFGRGYDPSELLNDHGAALKIDLRYDRRWRGATIHPYGFVDGGRVWARTRVPGLESAETASSAGGGVRVTIGRQFSGFVEIAKPLDRIVSQEGSRNSRIYAGLSVP